MTEADELRNDCRELREALRNAADVLDHVWAAIGDALCSGKGLEKPYAQNIAALTQDAQRIASAALAQTGRDEEPAGFDDNTDHDPACSFGAWGECDAGCRAVHADKAPPPEDVASAADLQWMVGVLRIGYARSPTAIRVADHLDRMAAKMEQT